MNDETFLNRLYLLTLKSLAARDVDVATLRFGVDRDFCEFVCRLSIEEIEMLATSDSVFFRLIFQPEHLVRFANLDARRKNILLGLAPKRG